MSGHTVQIPVQVGARSATWFITAMTALSPIGIRVFGGERWLRWAANGAMRLVRVRVSGGGWQRLPR